MVTLKCHGLLESSRQKMQAGILKARCLKVMDRVQATGEPVIVTKRGKPIVEVMPAEQKKHDWFRSMKG